MHREAEGKRGMVNGYLDLVKFITQTLGVPGALLAAACAALAWMLKREMDAHEKTRQDIQAINEKRIETALKQVEATRQNGLSLEALAALVRK